MMQEETIFTLINKQIGNLAFKFYHFHNNCHFDYLQRNNYYTVVWVKRGEGMLKVDFTEYLFQGSMLFAFAPFQPFMFSAETMVGLAIHFHSDFYCIHRNPSETNCDNVLFNNIYEPPFVTIDEATENKFNTVLQQLQSEFECTEPTNHELLVPYLKILLVNASRIKAQEKVVETNFIQSKVPFVIKTLRTAIEQNFKTKHSANDYATLLNISPNALAKLVKAHFNKTLTELITERMIIEAKRELYMTSKTIKEIAWKLGYDDEFYFSRFFKNNTNISPQNYRETVGFGKAELLGIGG